MLLILHIFIKPNLWYFGILKVLAIKRWFTFNFAKILQGRHFVVGEPENVKLITQISFDGEFFEFTAIFNVSNMTNLCQYTQFIRNSKFQLFLFWKTSRQNNLIFHFSEEPLFRNGWSYWYECRIVLRNFCSLSKKCKFAAFSKI